MWACEGGSMHVFSVGMSVCRDNCARRSVQSEHARVLAILQGVCKGSNTTLVGEGLSFCIHGCKGPDLREYIQAHKCMHMRLEGQKV